MIFGKIIKNSQIILPKIVLPQPNNYHSLSILKEYFKLLFCIPQK